MLPQNASETPRFTPSTTPDMMKNHPIIYFEEGLARHANKTALIDENAALSLSFATLHELGLQTSAKILEYLLDQNLPLQKNIIAIELPKGHAAILVLLGCLNSGNTYMPVDINSPKLDKIYEKVQPTFIINESNLGSFVDLEMIEALKTAQASQEGDEATSPEAVELNQEIHSTTPAQVESKISLTKEIQEKITTYLSSHSLIQRKDLEEVFTTRQNYYATIDTDLCYIINTSGSTGVPKGVPIRYASVINYLLMLSRHSIAAAPSDTLLSQAPLFFDNSVLDVYSMLFFKSALLLVKEGIFSFPSLLIDAMVRHSVTYIFFVPSYLVSIASFDALRGRALPNLARVVFAGEVMPSATLSYLIAHLKHASFTNLYGPTEAAVDISVYHVTKEIGADKSVPIGRAGANSSLFIIDESGALVAKPNIKGELYIRGTCLALGYYNNPEKTALAFVQNPLQGSYPEKVYKSGDVAYYNESGEIILCGRKDNQIKLSGYRIELGEVESALLSCENVGEVVCIFEGGAIVAVIVPKGESHSTAFNSKVESSLQKFTNEQKAALLKEVRTRLARYMVPSHYYVISRLPKLGNGKVDRNRVRELYRALEGR